ncbi:MAG: iron-sulfur cluster-binding protein [Acidobacteria bacterium]|nr:iron-sulfur cluster-binding protein [Acidobacteriota bacterium]
MSAPEPAIRKTLADANLQLAIYNNTGRFKENRRKAVAPEKLPEYQKLRSQAAAVKRHTLDFLDVYLMQLEAAVTANGGKIVWASTGQEAADFILNLAKERGHNLIVKSKSMTSEEIHLNERLIEHELEAVETDLGEYILQLAGQRPFHIVAPAIHLTRDDVADLFTEKLGIERDTVIENQAMTARRVLREKFMAAGIGITGANFLIADSGAVVIVENEGNARLTHSAPKIHIAIAGIEKLIPRMRDLGVFLDLLGRSASGQPLTSYTSIVSGPRREGELDGPEEFYVVLLDSGRTKVLADSQKRESLQCIRCGACLNTCPVYRKIGGHNYPWVYSGPIGKIITPQFQGREKDPWLPFASSLCGACAEVCPVKIDIPGILLQLRREHSESPQGSEERTMFRRWAWLMRRPRIYSFAAKIGLGFLGRKPNSWLKRVPWPANRGPLVAWLAERDFPAPPPKSFRDLWKERRR